MQANKKASAATEASSEKLTTDIISQHEFAYIRRFQFSIFPVVAGQKRPLTANGYKDATNDLDSYHELHAGKAHNIGMPTGQVNRLWVLDIDPKNGGDETYKHLLSQYGSFPPTWQVTTPSGGTHYYFSWDPKRPVSSRANVLPGIDIRGNGGYVVIPPSVTPAGQYKWVRSPSKFQLLQAPEWLYDVAQDRRSQGTVIELQEHRSQRIAELQDIAAGVNHGERNASATRLAGYLMRHIDAVVAEHLLKAWDATNNPPLGTELDTVIDSIARAELRRRGWTE